MEPLWQEESSPDIPQHSREKETRTAHADATSDAYSLAGLKQHKVRRQTPISFWENPSIVIRRKTEGC